MRIGGWRSKHEVHGATGDSVKCLVVLAGLLEDRSLRENAAKLDDGVSIHYFFPSARVPRVGRRNPFFTVRIGAVSGEKLLIQIPGSLAELYSKYSRLRGVGLNSKSEPVARGQVRYWWVLFRDQDTLEEIVLEFGGFGNRRCGGVRCG
jgi:hypothetical protein